jgi:cutinase
MLMSCGVSGVAVAAIAVGLPVPQVAAGPGACPDVEVIFARGTGEPAGLGVAGTGVVGQAFVAALAQRLNGRTVDAYAVNYPADFDFLAADEGAEDAAARIATVAARCPDTKLVLGGYSQGAAVIDMLANVGPLGPEIGGIGSAPPLSAPFADKISAVAVFGNPADRFGTPLSDTGSFAGRAIDLCNSADPICSPQGDTMTAHEQYQFAPSDQVAADFVAARL